MAKKGFIKNISGNTLSWIILSLVAIVCVIVSLIYFDMRQSTDIRARAASMTGNGAPSGSHYNLNIHGVPNGKTASMTGSSGHNIFVPEYGNAR